MRPPVMLDDVESGCSLREPEVPRARRRSSRHLQWSPASSAGRSRLERAELVLDGSLSGMAQFWRWNDSGARGAGRKSL